MVTGTCSQTVLRTIDVQGTCSQTVLYFVTWRSTNFIRALGSNDAEPGLLADRLTGARVEAGNILGLLDPVRLAGHAIGFAGAVRDRLADGPHGRDRFANGLADGLHAPFHDIVVTRAANRFHDRFTNRLARGRALRAIMGLANGPTYGLGTFADARFADGLANLMTCLVAMLLVDRLAHGVNAFLETAFLHLAIGGIAALFVVRLANGPADRFTAFFHVRALDRLIRGIRTFLHHSLVDRATNRLLNRLVGGFVAGLVAGLHFIAIARLGNRLHDRLADGLMHDVKALFQHVVVNELVRGPTDRVEAAEADLLVAAGLRAATVLGEATQAGLCTTCSEEGEGQYRPRSPQA